MFSHTLVHSEASPSVDLASPLLHNLNPEQLAAVTLPNVSALILAGAGSGKTRVLTTRIAWLLQTGQVSPGGLLAVTFTNKAAKEMLLRLGTMLPVNVRGMWIGTFHGLCNRLLRSHYKMANLPQSFQILDTQDQLSAIKRLCKQFNVDEERYPPKELQRFIGGCKEDGLRAKDVLAGGRTPDEALKKKIELYQCYEDQCQRDGVVDFGELMLRCYELLRDNASVREHYQRRFRHILIDEFQDTNKLQYAWIKLFAGETAQGRFSPGDNSVIAVGDDDQSIYAFRGARVGNMTDFVREFGVQHQIKLEENYRSYSNILDSANELISHNTRRLGKNLRTTQGAGEPVRVVEYPSDLDEARGMVDEMLQLIKKESIPRKEIAVLYRSNAQSRVIETALFNAAVPYKVYGGLRFFERAEIKHALAYLRLLERPNDDTSFLRVVNFPPRGIGARSLEQLQDAASTAGCSLHSAVSVVGGKVGSKFGAFVAGLDVLREQTVGRTLREIIELVLAHSGLLEHYRADREGADRVENLEELVNAAESFVTQQGFGRDAVALPVDEWGGGAAAASGVSEDGDFFRETLVTGPGDQALGDDTEPTGETLSPLTAFLTHAALEAGDNQAKSGEDAVQLMTVHSSKGLEFDAVFITGLEEGLFPHENSANDRDGLEEERRLMYVAITRARQRLYLSFSQTRMLHGQTRYNLRSRFFDELPEAALKWITPKKQGFGQGFSTGFQTRGTPNSIAGNATGQGAYGLFGRDAPAKMPLPVPKQSAATGPNAWVRAGVRVFHNKFGEGSVVSLEGTGDDARAQVSFGRHGVKWLALSVAKLTQV
jgi:DNA helicase II / ATP-dependent DNA helicase PcrA